jgi:hypothetical protein
MCQVGDTVLREIRCAFIGSPLSPPLCILSVMRSEYELISSLSVRPLLWKAVRYVDNRLAIWVQVGKVESLPQTVARPDFYGAPVLLEPEPDLSYVGCELHIMSRSMELSYKVPGFSELAREVGLGDKSTYGSFSDHQWRYRVGCSDLRAIRSGLEARVYGAARLSFPMHRARAALAKIYAMCIHLQYPSKLLYSLLSKHSRKFPDIYNHSFLNVLRTSVRLGGARGVIQLVEATELLETLE